MKYIAIAILAFMLLCAILLSGQISHQVGRHIVLVNGERP